MKHWKWGKEMMLYLKIEHPKMFTVDYVVNAKILW